MHKDKEYNKSNLMHKARDLSISYRKRNNLTQTQLEFLFWAYNYEFFTIKKASEDMRLNRIHVEKRVIYPLRRKGYVFNYFNKLTPSNTVDDQMFREETKFNYRVRYAITQKARGMVDRFNKQLLE